MKVVIPFKTSNPKSRLSSILSEKERYEFALRMLLDVIDAVRSANGEVKVISPTKLNIDVNIVQDSSPLNDCINRELKEVPKAVIMSDLPLISPELLRDFFSRRADIVIAPGRKGGTNMLLVRREGFKVSYHYGSFMKHVRMAKERGFSV